MENHRKVQLWQVRGWSARRRRPGSASEPGGAKGLWRRITRALRGA